jgi:hypothetical protein
MVATSDGFSQQVKQRRRRQATRSRCPQKVGRMRDKPRRQKSIRLRWIVLGLYLVTGGVLVGDCFLHLGHSDSCQYALYALLPAGFVSAGLIYVLIPWSLIPQGSILNALELLILIVPLLASCLQYYLLGVLLEKIVGRWQGKS